MNWFIIFEFALYVFHFSMFLMLIVRRKYGFTGAFFDIFRMVLAADLLCYVCTFIVLKFPVIFNGQIKFDPLVQTIILAASLYFAIMEFLGHLLLAYNRFTLLWYPRTFIWQRSRWYLWLLLSFPLIQAIFQFTPYVLTFSSLVLIASTCLAAVFNTLTFLKLYIAQHAENIKHVKEMNLMIVSFIIFIAQVLRSSYDVFLFLGDANAKTFFLSIFAILQCTFAISGSVSMLILSKKIRTSYISFYFPKSFAARLLKSSEPVIITVSRAPTKSSVNRF